MTIAIIGAGIAGASVAYHLTQATSTQVTVYDRGNLASATTAKSGALFGDYGTPTERRFKQYGRRLYNQFLTDPHTDASYEQIGRLDIATTATGADDLNSTTQDPPDAPPAFSRFIPGDAIHDHVVTPDLNTTSITGARYWPHVGYFTPQALAHEFIHRARTNGARFTSNTPVETIHIDNNTLTGLTVDGTTIEPEAVICTAGPWTPHLLSSIGLDLPMYHSLAPIQQLTHTAPYTMPNISHQESGTYLIGRTNDTVLLGHYPRTPDTTTRYEPATVPDTVPAGRRDHLHANLATFAPALADATVEDEWVGLRSHTPDGNPIIGWTGIDGLSLVAFNSSGIQLAPAAGRIITKQLVHGEPSADYEAISITRFDGFDDQHTTLEANDTPH